MSEITINEQLTAEDLLIRIYSDSIEKIINDLYVQVKDEETEPEKEYIDPVLKQLLLLAIEVYKKYNSFYDESYIKEIELCLTK